MKKRFDFLKKYFLQYRRAVIHAILSSLPVAFNFSCLPAIYRIKSLEIGEYPEEPTEIISQRLQEMIPVIITEAVVGFLLLAIIFFMVFLIYWSKRYYNISLVQKFRTKIFKKV